MNKKIILTGGTGLIGKNLFYKLQKRGDEITVFTRNTEEAKKILRNAKEYIQWDYNNSKTWEEAVTGKDAVIHLAGAPVNDHRWSDKYKKLIYESRIISTKQLVAAIEKAEVKPEAFICSSAVGYYGNSGNTILTEENSFGSDFLSSVCKDWEKEAAAVQSIKFVM